MEALEVDFASVLNDNEQQGIEEEVIEIKDEPVERFEVTTIDNSESSLDDVQSIKDDPEDDDDDDDDLIEVINYEPVDPKHPSEGPPKDQQQLCHLCAFIGKPKEVSDHFKKVHLSCKNSKLLYHCILCEFDTFFRHLLEVHMFEMHPGEGLRDDLHTALRQITYKTSLTAVKSNTSIKIDMNIVAPPRVNKKVWRCKKCNFTAENQSKIEFHVKRCHSHEPVITCLKCKYKTTDKKKFELHVRSLCLRFPCPNKSCFFISQSKKLLDIHLTSTHVYRCQRQGCTYRTYDRQTLDKHVSFHEPLTCKEKDCGFKATSITEFNAHHKTHVILLKCYKPGCTYTTTSVNFEEYQKHINLHKIVTKIFHCRHSRCPYKTGDRMEYLRHMQKHDITILKCFHSKDSCAFETQDLEVMKRHMATHKDKSAAQGVKQVITPALKMRAIELSRQQPNVFKKLKFIQCNRCSLSIRDEGFEAHMRQSHGERVIRFEG